ncbi:MAG: hypothetical protein KKH12_15490 [Gammaproteobacteria bacterium]|nr:hypothetical protein [Gammaproteobacteria bacterium]MBU1483067.1 hypothetical protein [Gammaproteobacteria bacterium]
MLLLDAEYFLERDIFVQVLPEFTGLALNIERPGFIDQEEDIQFSFLVWWKRKHQVASASVFCFLFVAHPHASHQRLPLKPLSGEKTPNSGGFLQDKANVLFPLVCKTTCNKGIFVKFSGEGFKRLRVFCRFLVQMYQGAAVFLLLSVANSFANLAQQFIVGADCNGSLIEKAGCIDSAGIDRGVDALALECGPIISRSCSVTVPHLLHRDMDMR